MGHDGALVHQAQQVLLGVFKRFEILLGQGAALLPEVGQLVRLALLAGLQVGGVDFLHLGLLGFGGGLEVFQCRLIFGHVHPDLGHQVLIQRGSDAVILRRKVQIEGGGLVDVHGQGAVIPEVELHHVLVIGVRGVILAVVDLLIEREDRLHILL